MNKMLLLGLLIPSLVLASPIEPGFDLFQTKTGKVSSIDLSSIGGTTVDLKGNPDLLASANIGSTDTIVKRLHGISSFNAPNNEVLIRLVALSLKSLNPIDIGFLNNPALPSTADLYVTVNKLGAKLPNLPQPDTLTWSIGAMTVNHENSDAVDDQGTFKSLLLVYADLIFVKVGGNVNNAADRLHHQADSTAPWKLEIEGNWRHKKPDSDFHNAEYPAGKFYITTANYQGTHKIEPTLVTLVEGSFAATVDSKITFATATEINHSSIVLWRGELKPEKTACSMNIHDYNEVKPITEFAAKGKSGGGAVYAHEDADVKSGNRYCYVLEDIDLYSKSTFHFNDILLVTG